MTDQADIAAPTGAAPAAAPATPAAPAAPASPAPAPQAAEAPAAGEAAPGADALSPEALSPDALSPDALAAADPSALPAVDPAPGMTDALAAVLPPDLAREASGLLVELADKGGPAGMVIAGLSVAALAVILWKIWRLFRLGAWSRGAAARALARLDAGDPAAALAAAEAGRGARARFAAAALRALHRDGLSEAHAREAAAREGRETLHAVQSGSRALELIATVSPLLGLLGTVLGMIEAFRQLQEAGGGADPSILAGGIWEALLTTAMGMAVAIPVTAALSAFDAAADRLRHDLEALGSGIFARPAAPTPPQAEAALAPAAPARAPAADAPEAWRAA